jgi:site-specific DNA recombinase
MRAGIYARVSKDQAGGRSVEEQETNARRDCERAGWSVAEVYVDNDRGASRHSKGRRHDFERLAADIAAGRLDVVVAWEASRLQRDLSVYLKLRDLCHRHGVMWSYSGRVYDMSRTDDRFQTGLDALLSEREADMTRDRVRRAVQANAEAGRPHGKLLFGYRREYDPATKVFLRQIPDERTAPVVRDMYARVARGDTCYRVASDLNARGVPTPRNGPAWTPDQVRQMLLNPGYVGKRVHAGQVVGDAVWPPLVDETTWHQVRRILTDPARGSARDSAVKHLLSGLATCGPCTAPLRVIKNRGYPSYMCFSRAAETGRGRFCVSIAKVKLDEWIEHLATERLARPDLLDLMHARSVDDDARRARDELAAARARLDEWHEAAAAGQVSPVALSKIEARLLPEIEKLTERATRTVPAVVMEAAGPDAAARWERFEVDRKRQVIRALMTVALLPTGRGRRTFDPERVRVDWRRYDD